MKSSTPTSSSSEHEPVFYRCPACSHPFSADLFEVLEERGSGVLFYVQCPKCTQGLVGTFLFDPEGVLSLGILTDLTKDDMVRFREKAPISSDDVLSYYEYWQQS